MRSGGEPCRSVQEPVRLELGRDLLDGLLDVRGLARPGADDLAAAEHQQDHLRIVDPVDQAGELLRLVFGAAEGEGDRLEVELVPEGSRRDDVLDPEFGHGESFRAGIADTGTGGGTCTQPVPYILPSAQSPPRRPNGLLPETAGRRNRETLPTPYVSIRSTRPFASAHRSRRRKAWVSAPLRAITSPPRYAVPVSQSLTTRSTRYRGFCRTAMNSAIFAAAHESLKVPWKTARRRCAMTAILFATSFRKERLWLTTSTMPGYVCRAAATISWLSMSRWFVGSSRTRRS